MGGQKISHSGEERGGDRPAIAVQLRDEERISPGWYVTQAASDDKEAPRFIEPARNPFLRYFAVLQVVRVPSDDGYRTRGSTSWPVQRSGHPHTAGSRRSIDLAWRLFLPPRWRIEKRDADNEFLEESCRDPHRYRESYSARVAVTVCRHQRDEHGTAYRLRRHRAAAAALSSIPRFVLDSFSQRRRTASDDVTRIALLRLQTTLQWATPSRESFDFVILARDAARRRQRGREERV